MMNIEELKRLAAPLVKWGADSAWENPDGTATVGYIDEDDNHDPIATVDVTIYDGFEDESLGIAQFIAAANPAAVLELIAEVDRLREDADDLTIALDSSEKALKDSRANDYTAMGYLADCRMAVGDNGKRMLPEFVEYLRQLKQQRDELLEALKDARELVDDWGAYATAYMQEKHDLVGDIDRLDAAISKVEK